MFLEGIANCKPQVLHYVALSLLLVETITTMSVGGLLVSSLSPVFKLSIAKHKSHHHHTQTPLPSSPNCKPGAPFLLSNLFSLAVAVTLNSPLPSSALPSLSSQSSLPSPTTPFSQSKNLQVGLENGKIRPCPSTNPGCVSTNPKSSSFAFPLTIPQQSLENALQKLQEAILRTQKNATIVVVEDTSDGKYLRAEVDGGGGFWSGRDVIEFLVKGDVAGYRCVATKVTYVYPFTTALGDSKGQEQRVKEIIDELGWYAPSFDSMD